MTKAKIFLPIIVVAMFVLLMGTANAQTYYYGSTNGSFIQEAKCATASVHSEVKFRCPGTLVKLKERIKDAKAMANNCLPTKSRFGLKNISSGRQRLSIEKKYGRAQYKVIGKAKKGNWIRVRCRKFCKINYRTTFNMVKCKSTKRYKLFAFATNSTSLRSFSTRVGINYRFYG